MSVTTVLGSLLDGYTPSIILATSALLLFCWQKLSLSLDPREPPILKPKIPFIGHVIGLVRYQMAYFDMIFAETPKSIWTLPMLNSKVYVVTEPLLAQSVFRSKDLSFFPFVVEFSQTMFDMSSESMAPWRNIPDGEEEAPFLRDLFKEIHTAVMGEHLSRMNMDALKNVANNLNGISGSIQPDSLYVWLRTLMTLATCNALLGSHSPFKTDPTLVDALWAFDDGQVPLIINVFPMLTAPAAYRGRATIQKALTNYYTAKHDMEADVSELIRVRAELARRYGISDETLGKHELAMLSVSTSNAIPTTFWLLCHICADPSLTEAIRTELEALVAKNPVRGSDGRREFSFDITKYESDCPLLVSSYREVIRLANSFLGTRRVMKDTTISDGKNTYLLKKGCDVQLPFGVSHLSTDSWGADAATFKARRFLKHDVSAWSEKQKQDDKVQKRSYMPFGGGKHMCPGRNFAFAEIMGTVGALVLGYDMTTIDGGSISMPDMGRAHMAEAIAKPRGKSGEMSARISRRKGYEDVVWKFVC